MSPGPSSATPWSFLVALLYQSTQPLRRAITDTQLIVGRYLPIVMVVRGRRLVGGYHFRVAIDGGVCAVARLGGLRQSLLVSVVVPPLSIVFARARHGCGRAWVGPTFARGGRRWRCRRNEKRGQRYHHHNQQGGG